MSLPTARTSRPPLLRSILAVAVLAGLLLSAECRAACSPSPSGEYEVHPIEHATFVLESGDCTIAFDPVGGAARFAPYPPLDLVLVTDIHGDHADAETLAGVVRDGTVVIAPQAVAEKLGDAAPDGLQTLANGESTAVGALGVQAIPMYNTGGDPRHPKGRGNGYVLTLGGSRIYVSGDTEGIPEMRALEGIDAAFVCMNLPYTMSVDEAADAVLEMRPKIVYPYHYRGKGGLSDVGRFAELIAAGSDAIEVRQLDWYPDLGGD